MAVTSRSSVPSFTPDLQLIPAIPHCKVLHDLLLSKIINAERASYHAPKFLKLTVRLSPRINNKLTNKQTTTTTTTVKANKQTLMCAYDLNMLLR